MIKVLVFYIKSNGKIVSHSDYYLDLYSAMAVAEKIISVSSLTNNSNFISLRVECFGNILYEVCFNG